MAGKKLLKQGERRRKAILRFIEKYHAKHNNMAPTIQEIADAVGLKSPNATRAHLFQLRDAGLITMQPKVARSIHLVQQVEERKAS